MGRNESPVKRIKLGNNRFRALTVSLTVCDELKKRFLALNGDICNIFNVSTIDGI